MTTKCTIDVGPPKEEARAVAYGEIVLRSFFMESGSAAEWYEREGRENMRIACCLGEMAGGLFALPMAGIRGVVGPTAGGKVRCVAN